VRGRGCAAQDESEVEDEDEVEVEVEGEVEVEVEGEVEGRMGSNDCA